MVDVVDAHTRSRMMSGIRGKDTQPEVRLRSALHRRGLRFRVHRRDLPGRPDIVFPSKQSVVLVHGCFWHRHPACRFATTPSTRPEFWAEKFAKNVERDLRDQERLQKLGWRSFTAWECQIRENVDTVARNVSEWLQNKHTT